MAIVATRMCRTSAMTNTPHLPQIVSVLSTPGAETMADACTSEACTIFRECQQGRHPLVGNKKQA